MLKFLLVAALLFSTPAHNIALAAESDSASTTTNPGIAKYIKAPAASGSGTYRKLGTRVYDIALWNDNEFSYKKPFALSLKYYYEIEAADTVEMSVDLIAKQHALTESEKIDYTEKLLKVIPKINDYDILTGVYLPNKGAEFYHNGKLSGKLTDKVLAKRFFEIWLSDKTSEPNLRNKLLASK